MVENISESVEKKAGAPLVKVEGLFKSFNGIEAVKGLNMTVNRGDLVGFMGPNGAGKSTTMRLLTGFLAADKGYIEVNHHDITKNLRKAQASFGYLPEQGGTFGHLTVKEYLTFLARSYGVSDIAESLRVATDMTRCNRVLQRPMETLSKGQRQRVFFAGAILHDPSVLILDEPTDGLDPNQKHEMRLVLKELAKHKAVIVSTHILEEAEAICNRVVIINHGRIVADTTPEELKRQGNGDIQVAFRILTTNKHYGKGD